MQTTTALFDSVVSAFLSLRGPLMARGEGFIWSCAADALARGERAEVLALLKQANGCDAVSMALQRLPEGERLSEGLRNSESWQVALQEEAIQRAPLEQLFQSWKRADDESVSSLSDLLAEGERLQHIKENKQNLQHSEWSAPLDEDEPVTMTASSASPQAAAALPADIGTLSTVAPASFLMDAPSEPEYVHPHGSTVALSSPVPTQEAVSIPARVSVETEVEVERATAPTLDSAMLNGGLLQPQAPAGEQSAVEPQRSLPDPETVAPIPFEYEQEGAPAQEALWSERIVAEMSLGGVFSDQDLAPKSSLEETFIDEWRAAAQSLQAQPSMVVTRPLEARQREASRRPWGLFALVFGALTATVWYFQDLFLFLFEWFQLIWRTGA
ncbi:MAG: hypothetical protein VYD19_08395 [Myxococcota bacterium]|nr:hypothetical protein [Myxococcota bacterium]